MKKIYVKIKTLILQFFLQWKIFGRSIALYELLSEIWKKLLTPPSRLLKTIQTKKYQIIISFLSHHFEKFIETYQEKSNFPYVNTKKIWTCRWQ